MQASEGAPLDSQEHKEDPQEGGGDKGGGELYRLD